MGIMVGIACCVGSKRATVPSEVEPTGIMTFADPAMQALCAKTWGDGTNITYEQAREVTTIPNNWARGNKTITSFNEIKYFKNLTSIGTCAFQDCSSMALTSLELPNCTSIGSKAFRGCSSMALTSLKLPRCTSIGDYAFYGCSSLNGIILPPSIITIGRNAFDGCTSLEIADLSLPNLETLASRAFGGVKITKISNLGKITAINPNNQDYANIGDKTVLKEVTLPNTIKTIGSYTFSSYKALETITIESGASGISVGQYAFKELTALTNFNVDPACFVLLGFSSFDSFKLFNEITFQNVTSVGARAFQGATISKIKLPSVETMAGASNYEGIFSYCKNLVLVDLGENCSSIGSGSFGRYVGTSGKNITIICRAVTPPSLGGSIISTVGNVAIKIYVPDESVETYKTATNWSAYANKILPLSQFNG